VPQGDAGSQRPPSAASRTLVYATRVEPASIATRGLGQGGSTPSLPVVFDALIAYIDESGTALPFVVESLPVLNSDSWRVFPDGRMETTYRLKPGIRWHDGTPASAEDFRFTWQLYTKPELYQAATPFNAIDEVVAVDERTVLIRWKQLYPEAGTLSSSHEEFPVLPAHILRGPFEQLDPAAFTNLPFWNREYVGLGPYRLDRWEAGSFLEGVAFDAYILGRPKIERLRVVFIEDANTALANLLTGQVHMAADDSIGLEQIDVIKRDASDRFALQSDPGGSVRATFFQMRPEYVVPRAPLDRRVREALSRTFDRDGLNEAVFFGLYIPAFFTIGPGVQFAPAAERGAIQYPFDPRRSEQLMNEAGFSRGADGFYSSGVEGRFAAGLNSTPSGADSQALTAMASAWRQFGFDVQESIIPVAQARDAEVGNTFPGMTTRTTTASLATLVSFTTARVPRPENRWFGNNRGGWSNADYDRLAGAFTATLDAQARADLVTEMARVLTADLPLIPMLFLNRPIPYPLGLTGPKSNRPAGAAWAYNVHEWEFR